MSLAPSAPDRATTTTDLVAAARAALDADVWAYLAGGAETETTLRRDRAAFDRLALRPRVATGVDRVDATATGFGPGRIRLPLALAPVGSLGRLHPDGIAGAARAAADFGVPVAVSSVLPDGLARAAAAAPSGERWYQLYVEGDAGWTRAIAAEAEAAGYRAFVVTLDVPVMGRRERPTSVGLARFEQPEGRHRARLSWRDLERLAGETRLPLLLKGIATAEDARIAVDCGAAGVWVSTHGGRQLDHSLGALDLLPEVVDAVAGRARIILDGGIRRGSDIVKALALGADLVAIGRMLGFGLAAGGGAGVLRMLELLEAEFLTTLLLLGVPRLADLGPGVLRPAPAGPLPVDPLRAAFPHLPGAGTSGDPR